LTRRTNQRPLCLIAGVDEFERILPGRADLAFRIGNILEIDVDRTGPVLRRRGEFEIDVPPDIQLDPLDRAVEMLQFYGALVFIDGNNLEQVAVQSPIPAANFRDGYPMISVQLYA
jgi:hypothetical protein